MRRVQAINSNDDFVRPDLPPAPDQEQEDEDHDYRRRDRIDVRGGQFSRDEKHLRILSILYYVVGWLGVIAGLFPLFLGVECLNEQPASGWGGMFDPCPGAGCFLIVIGLLIGAMTACTLLAGYNLSHKKRYFFCFVIACIYCIQIPLGTILGAFTIVVLARPSVKQLFDRGPTETISPEER